MAIAYQQVKTANNKNLVIRLGDIFTVKGKLLDIDAVCLRYAVKPLAILAVAFCGNTIHFTIIGLDETSILRLQVCRKSVIVVDLKGKKFKFTDKYLMSLFINKSIESDSLPDINGIPFSVVNIAADPSVLGSISLRKIKGRLMDIRDWPERSLLVWAEIQLGLGSFGLAKTKMHKLTNMEEKRNLINSLLQAKIAEEKRPKMSPKKQPKSTINASGFSGEIMIESRERGVNPAINTINISDETVDTEMAHELNTWKKVLNGTWEGIATDRISGDRIRKEVYEMGRNEPITYEVPRYAILNDDQDEDEE